ILGSITDDPVRRAVVRMVGRSFALLALLVLSPVLLGTAFFLKARRRDRPVLHRTEVVRLPADKDESTWENFPLWSFLPPEEMKKYASRPTPACKRDFLLRVLPGLVNVVRGELGLVGVPSRSREQIKALAHDWQTLYRSGKAGLITEAAVYCGPNATEE